jgi:hypothetical protein
MANSFGEFRRPRYQGLDQINVQIPTGICRVLLS